LRCHKSLECSLSRNSYTPNVVRLESSNSLDRVTKTLSGDDLQCHLSYAPRLIGSSTDYSSSRAVPPGIEESSHGPNSWPVATRTSREPINDGVSHGSSKCDQ
jgi:hypothetical protein